MRSKMWLFLLVVLTPCLVAAETGAPCGIERAAAAGPYVWLLCQNGELLVSSDEGASWQVRKLPAEGRLRALAFLDARRGFVAGDGGLLMATEDGGQTWRQVPVPTKENLTSICFVGELGWISGWTGLILHSADGGKTWVRQQTGVLQGLDCVYFTDPQHGWAVGWVGTILRTTDGGRTWEKAGSSNTFWSLNSVYFRDNLNGWAVGFNGQILRTRDGGLTWEKQASPVQASFSSVLFDGEGRGYITADDHLLVSDDEGQSWRSVPFQGTLFLHQLLPLRRSLWAVGRFGVLARNGPGLEFQNLTTLPKAASTGS